MEERLINQVVGQVMIYDNSTKQWLPAGTSSGLSTVRLFHCVTNNTFRIHGQKLDDGKEVVVDNVITVDDKFNLANDCFVRWHDKSTFWGINFRHRKGGSEEADSFFESIKQILNIINGSGHFVQQPAQQTILAGDSLANNQRPLQTQNSASVIQRPIQPQQQQQQMLHQPQVVQQNLMHQQQQHQQQQQQQAQMMNLRMMNEHQAQAAGAMLGQGPLTHIMPQQTNQPMMQQQQIHAQFMQQQAQSQPNQNQINHYQHAHQQQIQPPQQPQPQAQPQQIRQPPHQIQQQQQMPPQSQPAQVVAAPIPPPPPPPPPPPIAGLANNRVNGTSNNNNTNHINSNNNDAQHSPIANTNGVSDRNGGSPVQQASSLANELAKCQLKKVTLSRSDSDKESECNNNNVGHPKTTRAASIAHPNLFMSELSKRIEQRNQKGDTQSNCSTNSILNDNGADKDPDWLANLIRKEIREGMNKMKTEIIEAIRAEMKQRP